MTFEEYKKELTQKVFNFIKAYDELNTLFVDNEDFDCNDFICDDYPFEKSFDEYFLKLSDWDMKIKENLEHYKKTKK